MGRKRVSALLLVSLVLAVVLAVISSHQPARLDRAPKRDAADVRPLTASNSPKSKPRSSTSPAEKRKELRIDGGVVSADGRKLVTGARVVAEGGGPPGSRCMTAVSTDGQGFFRLILPGTAEGSPWKVFAIAPDGTGRSAPYHLMLDRATGSRPPFVLLRIRESMKVSGRVLGPGGDPVPGVQVLLSVRAREEVAPWTSYEVGPEITLVETDRFGRFSAPTRRGDGEVRVRGRRGAFGSPLAFHGPPSGDLDVGDLPDPDPQLAEWLLHLVDDDGSPCTGAAIFYEGTEAVNQDYHPRFDPETEVIRADGDGTVRILLPSGPDPAFIAAGGVDYESRCLALDRSRPIRREATVRLDRRPSVLLHLVGPAAASLVEGGVVVEIRDRGLGGGRPIGRLTANDVVTGRQLVRPSRAIYTLPQALDRCLAAEVEQVSPGSYLVRPSGPGTHLVRLILDGFVIHEEKLQVEASDRRREVNLTVPGGRLVTLDCSALARGSVDRDGAGSGATAWLSVLAAWPHGHRPGPGRGIGYHVVLIDHGGRASRENPQLWLPAGADSVGVGFLEDSSSGWAPSPGAPEPIYLALPTEPGRLLVIPALTGDPNPAAYATIQLTCGGEPLPVRGIQVWVHRKRGLTVGGESYQGSVLAHSDAEGRIRVALFPGEYLVAASQGVARSQQLYFTVRDPAGETHVDLDVEFHR